MAAIPEDASKYPSRMVYRGVIKRDQENWQGAVDDLSAALELATAARDRRAMAYIHLYRGPAYYRLDKLDAAIDDIDEAIKLGYDDAEAHLWRGKLLVQKGQTDLAFEAFKKAKELDPYDKEVRAALVQLYERLNLYDLATDELNELAKDDTNEPAVIWAQVRIHYKSKRYDEALAVAEKLLEIEPDHVGARVCQARIYFAKGDKRSLERIALRLMALKLDNGGDFAQRGFCLDACGLTVDAMKDFDQAIALGYRDSSVHTCRAQIHARRSEWEKVVAEATAAIKLDARNKDAYYARGVGLLWLKKTDEGVADFDRAIRIEPNFVRALVARALTFANTNRKGDAIADLRTAVGLDPDNADISIAFLTLLADEKRLDEYGVACCDAIRRFPNDASNYWRRASYWGGMGNHAMAIADLTEAIRLEPKRGDFHSWRAASYLEDARVDLAIADLEAAERLGPLDVQGTYVKGKILELQGDYRQAIELYRRLTQGSPLAVPGLARLARVYATAADDAIRDGKKALEYAEEACAAVQYREAKPLSYLAAAHAESGDFDKAVESQTKAIALATDDDRKDLTEQLELYKARKPYRQTPTPRVAAKVQ